MEGLRKDGAILSGTGIVQHIGVNKIRAGMPAAAGRHLFVMISIHRVVDPVREDQVFDHETLLTVDGPVCWHCGQPYSSTLSARCSPLPEHGEEEDLGGELDKLRARAANLPNGGAE